MTVRLIRVLLMAVALALGTAPASADPLGPTGPWTLQFSDDFSGTSIDRSKWTPVEGCTQSESGGVLHVEVRSPGGCGKLESTFGIAYGALEARLWLPAAPDGTIANWPGWWTTGANWPADGEIDVLEGGHGEACWHTHDPSGGPGGCVLGQPFAGSWHTYTADWEAGSVSFYYDGVLEGSTSFNPTGNPNHLLLDMVTGGYGGTTVIPADMQADYVRVWQRPARLLGDGKTYGTLGLATHPGTEYAQEWTASKTAPIKVIEWFSPFQGSATTEKVGVWSDAGGKPGTVLGEATHQGVAVASMWNGVPLSTPVNVSVGARYWLAILTLKCESWFVPGCNETTIGYHGPGGYHENPEGGTLNFGQFSGATDTIATTNTWKPEQAGYANGPLTIAATE